MRQRVRNYARTLNIDVRFQRMDSARGAYSPAQALIGACLVLSERGDWLRGRLGGPGDASRNQGTLTASF